jgi:predicted hotdog family 3-hydroxylacyl-ACP dehydratase
MHTPDIRTLLPHSGRSVLLERLVVAGPDAVTAELTIREDSPYFDNGGVGAWIGLEYMAQAAAALAGSQARAEGGGVRQGVLLGTRRYECDRPSFPLGSVLRVSARRAAPRDAALSLFECRIEGEGINAAATISIYHGARIETLLAGDGE